MKLLQFVCFNILTLTTSYVTFSVISYSDSVQCISLPSVSDALSSSSLLMVDAPTFADIMQPESARNASTSAAVNADDDRGDNASVHSEPPWSSNRRLPSDVVPEHYDVTIHPNLETGYFTGEVNCFFKLTSAAARPFIQLHSSKLNITAIELWQLDPKGGNSTENATAMPIANYFLYPKNEFLIINVTSPAQAAARYLLHAQFDGTMLNKINGLYRTAYTNNNNNIKTNYIMVSQMGPTYARQVFPCFDEPTFKATFNISISHAAKLTALSNMPEMERVVLPNDNDGKALVLTRFAKTPPMATFLTAMVVSDFKFIEHTTSNGVRLRAYGTAEQVETGSLQWALDVLNFTIGLCEKYFEIPYQLPKLDIIGVPDFLYGAMENWGCIIFRERYLIYNPREASAAEKRDVATVVAHEVAHQWFGNLVTMAWWDALWLKESFATRFEFSIDTNKTGESINYLPEHDWFVATQMQRVMGYDSLGASHPIVVPSLTDPADISALFDEIPYLKGTSVFVMLENFLGAETFRKGVVRLFRKHSFSTVTTDDLWLALTEQQLLEKNCTHSVSTNVVDTQCDKIINVKQVMDTWLFQQNYPVLTVSRLTSTQGQVKQDRFLLTNLTGSNDAEQYPSPYNYSWHVPVVVRNLDSGRQQLVWSNRTDDAVFEWKSIGRGSSPPTNISQEFEAILLNVGQPGFYRVNYPLDLWTTLIDRLDADVSAIPDARDRSGLVSDAFELARANLLPYSVPLHIFYFLKFEPSLAVWQTASAEFRFLDLRLRSVPEAYAMWRHQVQFTVRPALDELGWQDEGSSEQQQLRELLLYMACQYGDPESLEKVRQMFRDWSRDGKSVPPNFRSAVYKFGMSYAEDDQPWERALKRLTTSKTPQEIRLILTALTSSSQPWQAERLLHLAWNTTYVRLQDLVYVYEWLAANPVALPYVWNYYRINLPRLIERRTLNDAYLGKLPLVFAEQFNTQLQLDEMKALFANLIDTRADKYPEAGAGRLQRRQAIETIENNIAWLKRHSATIVEWLDTQQ